MLLDHAEELPPPTFGEDAEATFLTEAGGWEELLVFVKLRSEPTGRVSVVVTVNKHIWLVVWNIFCFSIYLGVIIPIDVHIFQRGGSTTNQTWRGRLESQFRSCLAEFLL